MAHKSGFVNILGRPNAGKSTLLNALLGEKLAIISPKVQTTRHRILGILTQPDYQVVFSDTPGIITPEYKLQEKMMHVVTEALEDADVVLLMMDAADNAGKNRELFSSLKIKVPRILVINKTDTVGEDVIEQVRGTFAEDGFSAIIPLSALAGTNLAGLLDAVIRLLPNGPAFYPPDMLTEKPVRFFVSELIRENIYSLYRQELPYQTAVLVRQFEEKNTLTKISADIIVERESQKAIILGHKGVAVKELGTRSRQSIEDFIGRKVFLELHVKVRAKWREKENFLKEYGY